MRTAAKHSTLDWAWDTTALAELKIGGEDICELPGAELLQVEIVDTQACPKFHCDNVYIRLVTTYVGPATEYRFVGETMVNQAEQGSLVFLKGRKHPTHRDSVHHRSPAIPEGVKRLCVVLDC